MKSLRRFNKDRVSGVLLVLLGIAIVAQGVQYRMGALTRMGAGYIPVVLGVLIGLVGLAIFVLGTYGGLVPATFFSVFIAALGDRGNNIVQSLILSAGITVAGILIFYYGLSMTFPLFTWG
jgi:hypothetical protein